MKNTEYIYKRKVLTNDELVSTIETLRKNLKTIVFTNGCFDIIHPGHIHYLRSSRLLGDCLIIGVNSDDSVKRLKGSERPINNIEERLLVLEALDFVDYLIVFSDDTPFNLIQSIHPNIYTKGGDYDLVNIIGKGLGSDIIEKFGGRVKLIPIVYKKSSSLLIDEVYKSEQNS